jgi:hypothetical protein
MTNIAQWGLLNLYSQNIAWIIKPRGKRRAAEVTHNVLIENLQGKYSGTSNYGHSN